MSDRFAKRPKVTRFGVKKTYGPRTVKHAVVTRRTSPHLRGRPMRQGKAMRPMRKRMGLGGDLPSNAIKRAE